MTPDAIRALDGPGLTALAWRLGLASAYPYDRTGVPYNWAPHIERGQAYDALCLIPPQWHWEIEHDALNGRQSNVRMYQARTGHFYHQQFRTPHEEAYALLLVACLAVASEAEEPYRDE